MATVEEISIKIMT